MDTLRERFRLHRAHILWMICALIAARVLASLVLPVFDDAFITFRYARNLAMGHGFVYNPGEWVLGTTAPAFGLLLAIPHLFGLPMPGSVIAFNILCDVGILLLTLLHLLRNGEPVAGLLFGGILILSPIFSRVAIGGMEADLFLLLGLAAILLYHRGRRTAAIALAALCYFLRPEGVMLVGILCLTEFIVGERKRGVLLGALALGLVLPGLALIHHTYGTIIPQSVAAKSGLPPQPYGEIFRRLLALEPFAIALLPLAIWGGIRLFRRGGFVRTVTLWGASYVVAYAIARPVVWPWYGVVTYYALFLLASFGVADLLGRLPALDGRARSAWGWGAAAGVPLLIWVAVFLHQGRDPATAHIYMPLQRWCDTTVTPGTTIAAYDIGALGYYSRGHIYDLAGLVWPEAVAMKWDYPAIILKYRPDYLYLFATKETADWMNRPAMRALYTPIARYSKLGITDTAVDREKFAEQWVQDYLLFKRREGPAGPGR